MHFFSFKEQTKFGFDGLKNSEYLTYNFEKDMFVVLQTKNLVFIRNMCYNSLLPIL